MYELHKFSQYDFRNMLPLYSPNTALHKSFQTHISSTAFEYLRKANFWGFFHFKCLNMKDID